MPPRTGIRGRHAALVAVMVGAALLAGCASRQSGGPAPGGYGVGDGDYRRDGPHANPPANLDRVPSAVPRIEPYASGANRPYVINGKRYVPDTSDRPYRVRGMASWYGRQFHGRPTSNGEIYDMYAMTAAHPTLPIPSYARVTRPDTGKSVIVRINDRGPFHSSRVIDLSYVAAYQLGTLAGGTAEVVVERITPDEIRRGSWPAPAMIAADTAAAPAPVATVTTASAVSPRPPADGWRVAGDPQPAAPAAVAQLRPADETPAAVNPLSVLAAIPVPEAPPPAPVRAPAPSMPGTAAMASTTPAAGGAFLQLGAFGEARNAELLAERVRAHVSPFGALQVVSRGDNVYRVQLGPFADRNSAVAHVDAVYGQTGIRPHVVVQ